MRDGGTWNGRTPDERGSVLAIRPALDLGARIVRCAQAVHRALGPGLEAPCYCRALALELMADRLEFVRDVRIDVRYRSALVGKREVAFVLEGAAVDLSAWPELVDHALLRARAETLRHVRPVGVALHFGAVLESAFAGAP